MGIVVPVQAAAGADCRTAIQNAIDDVNTHDGDTIRLNNQTSATWIVSGRADPNGVGGDYKTLGGGGPGAVGAIEFTKSVSLLLDPGITLQESTTIPIPELNQSLLRWKGKSNVGITFGAGSKILGQRSLHAQASEWMAGAKFINCSGITIQGTGEVHFQDWYGDGLWFASGGYPVLGPVGTNTGVIVNDVRVFRNRRNGITLESLVGTLRRVGGTQNYGTSPHSFMDIETDVGTEQFPDGSFGIPDTIQVTVDGGDCEGHSRGIGLLIANTLTNPFIVNLLNFKSMRSTDPTDDPWGFDFKNLAGPCPAGSRVYCENLQAYNIKAAGFKANLWDMSAGAPPLIFRNCQAIACATNSEKPFSFNLTGADSNGGGIVLDHCYAFEWADRAVAEVTGGPYTNLRGTIYRDWQGPYPGVSQYLANLPNLRVKDLRRRKTLARDRFRASAI